MYIPSSVSTPRAPARELIPAQPKTRDIGGKRYHKLRNVAGEGTLNKTFSLECKLRFLTSRPSLLHCCYLHIKQSYHPSLPAGYTYDI